MGGGRSLKIYLPKASQLGEVGWILLVNVAKTPWPFKRRSNTYIGVPMCIKYMFMAKNGDFLRGIPVFPYCLFAKSWGQVLWHACLTSAKNFNWLVVDFFKSIITSNPEMKSQVKIVMQIPWTYLFLWNITLVNPMDLHFHAFILYLQESEEHQTIPGSWLICILHILPSIQLLFSWLSGVPSSKLTLTWLENPSSSI